jgi:hypothetical protein
LPADLNAAGVALPAGSRASASGDVSTVSSNDEGSPQDRRGITEITYSADSDDVTPPVFIYPAIVRMLTRSSPGIRDEALKIALIINEQGRVDSVKAMSAPRNIGESVMLTAALSAVKAWRFLPAMKEGVPVKYIEIVPLSLASGADPAARPGAAPAVQANQP